MSWYWDVLVGIGIFNVLFVLVVWSASVVRGQAGSEASPLMQEAHISHECILHFLKTMCMAGHQKV
ncbi:MAG TPA: hypothetical protein VMT71_04940 [Syntrophorhabdales bacterium]|nr:hypothetical protein [Syntrophorhabdales bacterium]